MARTGVLALLPPAKDLSRRATALRDRTEPSRVVVGATAMRLIGTDPRPQLDGDPPFP
jgi:hypothetical protein